MAAMHGMSNQVYKYIYLVYMNTYLDRYAHTDTPGWMADQATVYFMSTQKSQS